MWSDKSWLRTLARIARQPRSTHTFILYANTSKPNTRHDRCCLQNGVSWKGCTSQTECLKSIVIHTRRDFSSPSRSPRVHSQRMTSTRQDHPITRRRRCLLGVAASAAATAPAPHTPPRKRMMTHSVPSKRSSPTSISKLKPTPTYRNNIGDQRPSPTQPGNCAQIEGLKHGCPGRDSGAEIVL